MVWSLGADERAQCIVNGYAAGPGTARPATCRMEWCALATYRRLVCLLTASPMHLAAPSGAAGGAPDSDDEAPPKQHRGGSGRRRRRPRPRPRLRRRPRKRARRRRRRWRHRRRLQHQRRGGAGAARRAQARARRPLSRAVVAWLRARPQGDAALPRVLNEAASTPQHILYIRAYASADLLRAGVRFHSVGNSDQNQQS